MSLSQLIFAQISVSGTIIADETKKPLSNVAIYEATLGLLTTTKSNGTYSFTSSQKELQLSFFKNEYGIVEKTILLNQNKTLDISLKTIGIALTAVAIKANKEAVFNLKRLNDVEGTAIYAGKKTEVVLVEQSMANLAANNARQIYSQVAGLNIYQNDDAGLQLNIGGRGLDPNRTANFNTRQNGYDISADVLGYPESYYTPTAEALQEIQIIRGAASLQYGTQFGGLINFVMKQPNPDKPIEIITRNTIGSNHLYTNFTSLGGTSKNWSYYGFYNYKQGDGFRPNAAFESKNAYFHLAYQFNNKTSLSGELTYLNYLAQQAGGLNDSMFEKNPLQSNRGRNWFKVDWLLYNLKFSHTFSEKTNFTFNSFGLQASRDALGFRSNRVDQIDPITAPRDLIKGTFANFGFEARLLHQHQVFNHKSTALIGAKYYKSRNTNQQGPGTKDADPNFDIQTVSYPNYPNQSDYVYPNQNLALFGENIFYLNKKFSVTPGFRLEYINTESNGFFRTINTDAAGNVILNALESDKNIQRERSFALLGVGLSYKANKNMEGYANISQNYRSITFSDISTFNPTFSIDPAIKDENGYTADLGIRGNYKNLVSYDFSAFGIRYNDRIGFSPLDNQLKVTRSNIGDALLYGFESLFDINLNKAFINNNEFNVTLFINTALTNARYTRSLLPGIADKKVEYVPEINLKTGLKFGYKNLLSNIQYTYLSEQFTDASNATAGSISGIIGEIPAYEVLDLSLSYTYKNFKLETGINNVLNASYFTRRATGYPGPGIIPSPNRNFYGTLEIKF